MIKIPEGFKLSSLSFETSRTHYFITLVADRWKIGEMPLDGPFELIRSPDVAGSIEDAIAYVEKLSRAQGIPPGES